jgi:molybdopterin-binding protein
MATFRLWFPLVRTARAWILPPETNVKRSTSFGVSIVHEIVWPNPISEGQPEGFTVVVWVAELLAVLGSASLPVVVAVLVSGPAAVGVTTISTVALAPLASDPRSQLTVPLEGPQVPWLGVAEAKVTPSGRVSVTSRLGHRARDRSCREVTMQLSARNQLTGTVRNVELGAVMAEVTVDVNGQQIVSAITRASAERLGLAEGQPVTVFIKATEVILGVE